MNEVCFKNLDKENPASLGTYESTGGYKVWRQILNGDLSPDRILTELKTSGLRGRRRCWLSNWFEVELYASQSRGTKICRL